MSDDEKHEESIKVCCRFRPQNSMELATSGKICMQIPSATTVVIPGSDQSFTLDRVFPCESTQKSVYDYAAKPIIDAVLKGFNGTVFAYGQTASGKTYTMEGPDTDVIDKTQQGVIPRMIFSIFEGIYHADENIEFLVKITIVEIYNERIRDLLDPKKENLKIHEDKTRGVFIDDATESYVGSENEIAAATRAAHYNRTMAQTNMNEHSSRSHLVFMLTVEQKNITDRSVKVGKLYLVDLAGSEKVGKTGAAGDRLDEAKSINRSLSALGNVINALTDRRNSHVPYRDSKLTRMLQESLGGNSKTSLIVTCSPSTYNEAETVGTLRFGQRAKMIKNVAKVNQERSVEELKAILDKREQVLLECRNRIGMLEDIYKKNQLPVPENSLRARRDSSSSVDARSNADSSVAADLLDQLQKKRSDLRDNAERTSELNRETDELQRQFRTTDEERKSLADKLSDISADWEKNEYERNELQDSVEKYMHEKKSLQEEIEALQASNKTLAQNAAEAASSNPSPDRERSGSQYAANDRVGEAEERSKDTDRPLKRKVSQLDKNLEQLTVMYHKLVAQNSGLRAEVSENNKKVQRKEQRISQLERNLREAKEKYEKLLTQCANLTAAMDVMGRAKPPSSSGGLASSVPRRSNIVRPLRGGGSIYEADGASGEGGASGTPLGALQLASAALSLSRPAGEFNPPARGDP